MCGEEWAGANALRMNFDDHWKAGIEALANKNVFRLNKFLHGFTKDVIITFQKAMLQ